MAVDTSAIVRLIVWLDLYCINLGNESDHGWGRISVVRRILYCVDFHT